LFLGLLFLLAQFLDWLGLLFLDFFLLWFFLRFFF
jgi:hypothetical protein